MKIRKGFVSNSSSSSFTCDVCGQTEGGMDLSLSDCDMCECENGHTILEDYLEGAKSYEDMKEIIIRECKDNKTLDNNKIKGIIGGLRYAFPARFCPICQLSVMTQSDTLSYLFKLQQTTIEIVTNKVKERFGDYKTFQKFLKEGIDNAVE